MEPPTDLKARNSFGADEENVPVPVMPAVPVMATPVLPVEKIRALSYHHGLSEQHELNDIESLDHRYDDDLVPVFAKRSSATILEVFYDFWVVANLSVFMNVHSVADPSSLWSYIGYISLVWFNWFLVGCFDVRYVTDSIFERIARTLHLGVVVGFAVVAPNYDPKKQNKGTWQCMSLILMVSRLVLVFEYLTILWHIRKFKKGKLPLLAAIVFHFIAAMVYLGVSFRFEDNRNSNAYIAWYLVMSLEAIVQVSLSLYSKILSFNGTHLCERMTILTMFILGEGVMVVMDSVYNIVKNKGWTSSTIGVLVAAVGTIYFVFMLYTDWMQGYATLVNWRQIAWSLLHFPFHVFLLLFIKGSSQFMIWWKVTQVETDIIHKFDRAFIHLNVDRITSEDVVASLNATIEGVWVDYKPVWTTVFEEIEWQFNQIRSIDDNEWNIPDDENSQEFWVIWENAMDYLRISVINSVFGNFKIDAIQDLVDSGEGDNLDLHEMNAKAYEATTARFYLVFQYVFACAGMAVVTMTILYLIIKRQPTSGRDTVFFYVRVAIFLLFGVGLSLVTLLSLDWNKGAEYIYTPWLLPTLCFAFFVLILVTHVPRLPNPMHAWTGRSGRDNAPSDKGADMTKSNSSDGAFVQLKSFMGNKKNSNSGLPSSSGGSSGKGGRGQYSQVHISEMMMSPGSRHSSGGEKIYHAQTAAAAAGTPEMAYDPYTWDPQQQLQQQPTTVEYFGTSAYAQAQPRQQAFSHYEQYQPQQPQYQPPPHQHQQQQYPQYPNQGY